MLKLKKLILLLLISTHSLFAIEVVITRSKINYHEIISLSKLAVSDVYKVKKNCTPLQISDFKSKKLLASRYLRKGTILCTKDIEEYKKSSVLFNFGSIEVERPGKVIFENDEYIKIKRVDGEIEKIYKDGRLR